MTDPAEHPYAPMTDDGLVEAYRRADPDGEEAAALAAEIERRGLGV